MYLDIPVLTMDAHNAREAEDLEDQDVQSHNASSPSRQHQFQSP